MSVSFLAGLDGGSHGFHGPAFRSWMIPDDVDQILFVGDFELR
jgi:hypothetical protein